MVRLWDIGQDRLLTELTGHSGWVAGIASSPTHALLATGGKDREIRLWRPATGETLPAREVVT